MGIVDNPDKKLNFDDYYSTLLHKLDVGTSPICNRTLIEEIRCVQKGYEYMYHSPLMQEYSFVNPDTLGITGNFQ